ncbi:MAG: LacI family DNA-binding transcriptional regulator [Bacteroidota bacterium]
MRGVAARAGVSVATVSRFYSGAGPVSDDARVRVKEAADALGYVPNTAARSLRVQRTATLGVVLPDLYGDFFSELLRGLDGAARLHDRHLLVAGSHGGADELAETACQMLGRVDGLIVMCPGLGEEVAEANLPVGLPVVLLGSMATGFPSISVDDEASAAAMVRHLAHLGHRRIALIAGPSANADALDRLAAYERTVGDLGLHADPSLVVEGDFTERSGHQATCQLLALADRPTAVFAANDSMAIGALRACREAGLDVPGDIALAGFDDIPVAEYVTPGLTSVHVPIHEMGARAVSAVLAAVDDPSVVADPVVLPGRLVVRQSCGGAA